MRCSASPSRFWPLACWFRNFAQNETQDTATQAPGSYIYAPSQAFPVAGCKRVLPLRADKMDSPWCHLGGCELDFTVARVRRSLHFCVIEHDYTYLWLFEARCTLQCPVAGPKSMQMTQAAHPVLPTLRCVHSTW